MLEKVLLLAGLLLTATSVTAGQTSPDEVSQRLKSLYPATTFTAVRQSPVDGLYEVIMGKNIVYTDQSGKHFLFGHLFDMERQKDMTAELMETLNRVDTASLPLNDALKSIHGNGKRHLYVFSDPDCPYCKHLEKELKSLDNVTIHTFLYPIAELHPQAGDKSRLVWCASDRNAAWRKLMDEESVPDSGDHDCENPLERNVLLGEKLGIEGTPAMIFEDGRMVQGYQTAAQLEALLQGEKN